MLTRGRTCSGQVRVGGRDRASASGELAGGGFGPVRRRRRASDDRSDYDFQLCSDALANRFAQCGQANPEADLLSDHGGHYKHRHLEDVAPELFYWARRWQRGIRREVTIATFGSGGPTSGSRADDWVVLNDREKAR